MDSAILSPEEYQNPEMTMQDAKNILVQKAGEGQEISRYDGVPLFTNRDANMGDENAVYISPDVMQKAYGADRIPSQPKTQDMAILDKVFQVRGHIKKNILGYDPENIDAGRDAMSARDYYLKQNPGDKNGADKVFQATFQDSQAKKAAGMQTLTMAENVVRAEELKRLSSDLGSKSEEQLIDVSQNDPDPEKRRKAQAILDKKQALMIERNKASGEGRASAYGAIKIGAYYDTKTDSVVSMNANDFNKANADEPGRYITSSASTDLKEKMAQAGQRGGATTANVVSAVKMYKQEAPDLIELREKAKTKGLLPESGFKDIGALNQWIDAKTNDPDVALLKKKTKFLADSLMRVMGGSQGGEWAFRVASDILDPSYSPEAFAAIVNSHGKAMERMAISRKNFGKNDNTITEDVISPTGRDISPITGYISQYADKVSQKSLYEQMKKSGWSDGEITTAWRKYKSGAR